MVLSMDRQVAAALDRRVAGLGEVQPRPPVGDWRTRREGGTAMFGVWAALQPVPTDVVTRDIRIPSNDGEPILLRWFEKSGPQPGSAALYLHGGGMLLGSVDVYDKILRRYVSASGVPLLAVDHRLPPEHPHPTPVEDGYAGLRWFADHAPEFGVDPARIAIMGDSAGGGLAAATAILASDRGGPAIAAQILIYPMLDDRNTQPDAEIAPFLTWTWTTTSPDGELSSASEQGKTTLRPTRHLLARPISPACRRPTSKWGSSTSSGTRVSLTCSDYRRTCQLSCTFTPALHTVSSCLRLMPTYRAALSPTASEP
jgi:acetyl esterase/lipase